MNPTTKAYIQVHISTLLYGLTAILGDLIMLNAVVLVWWRVVLASTATWIIFKALKLNFSEIKGQLWIFSLLGVLIGFHWVTFYGAIKLSNASLTLICFSTTSLFSSILEPLLTSKSFRKLEFIMGLLIIPFIFLIANDTELKYMNGIYLGLFSAFLVSIFGVLNKKYLKDQNAVLISGIELSSASIVLSLFVFRIWFYDSSISILPTTSDWLYLLVLSLLCTTFAFILTTQALKVISAFATALIINLEPVYGILLAWFILSDGEELNNSFYYGALAIAIIVFSFPFVNKLSVRK